MELAWGHSTPSLSTSAATGQRELEKPEYKVELWLLFPTQGLIRTLALDEDKLRPADEDRASKLYGRDAWRAIYERRVTGTLSASRGREEYVESHAVAPHRRPRIRQDPPV